MDIGSHYVLGTTMQAQLKARMRMRALFKKKDAYGHLDEV